MPKINKVGVKLTRWASINVASVLIKKGIEKDACKEEGDAGKKNGKVRTQGQEC